jgi:hypothetical protein
VDSDLSRRGGVTACCCQAYRPFGVEMRGNESLLRSNSSLYCNLYNDGLDRNNPSLPRIYSQAVAPPFRGSGRYPRLIAFRHSRFSQGLSRCG